MGLLKYLLTKNGAYIFMTFFFALFLLFFYALISADQNNGHGGALIAYFYITVLLPIMIITKFIINMVFSYLNLDYGFHIVSMCILLIFLVYLSAPNNDHSYRFFNLSNSSVYFYKSVIFHLFLFLLYHNKWANHKR